MVFHKDGHTERRWLRRPDILSQVRPRLLVLAAAAHAV